MQQSLAQSLLHLQRRSRSQFQQRGPAVRQCCCCLKRRCCPCTCCCRERGPSATGCHICESCCAVERAMQLVHLHQTPASASGSRRRAAHLTHTSTTRRPWLTRAAPPAASPPQARCRWRYESEQRRARGPLLPCQLTQATAMSASRTPASPHRHAFARTRAYAVSSHAAPKIKARTTASPASLSPLLPPVEKDTCQVRHTRTHTRVEELGHATHTHTYIHTYTRRAGKHHTHTRART
jgi:hypothetical protein